MICNKSFGFIQCYNLTLELSKLEKIIEELK